METQNEFVAKRLAAHAAACADVYADPLVAAALADKAAAAEVVARWKERSAESRVVPPALDSEYHYPGYGPRRQAE